jgi:UDP-2,3-diacylglucosamine pyrophosphatase LpxH
LEILPIEEYCSKGVGRVILLFMKQHHRAMWISDLHLFSRLGDADKVLAFLKANTADTIYLVGDIVDMWALSRKLYFPTSHVAVVKKLIALSKKHRIIYVPGNHDEPMRDFLPLNFGDIEVVEEAVHVTADGRRLLVCHGDKYDQVMQYARWLAVLGDLGYTFLLKSNTYVNWFRRRFGRGYWSLSAYAKRKVKGVVGFIGDFENAVAKDVAAQGYDGVICGHIHHAQIKHIGRIEYINTGDWCESFTAAVEDQDGAIKIVYFTHDAIDATPNSAIKDS